MSINYLKYTKEMNYDYNNLIDAIEDFGKITSKENREEIIYRINELQKTMSKLKVTIKNIYLR